MKVHKNERAKQGIYETYDKLLATWGVSVEEKDLETAYGATHVIECGSKTYPPLVLFHGVGDDSALMWVYNAKALSAYFHIFAVDTIGGPGKSRPNSNYNKDFDVVKWVDEVFDRLRLERAYVAGVSNGSHITFTYGVMRPERVIKMICMSGSPSVEGDKSPLITMLKVFLPEALIPTEKNVTKLIQKITGDNSGVFTENPTIMEHYTWLLRGFNNKAMAYHKIHYFNDEQLNSVSGKVLFLDGESDPLGDMEKVKAKIERYHMEYRFFPHVGHGINHEISDEINKIIIQYFNQPVAKQGNH